jgi:hypothetical protein
VDEVGEQIEVLAGGEAGQVVDAHQRRVEALACRADRSWFARVECAAGDVPGELVAEGSGEADEVLAGRVAIVFIDESGAVVPGPYPGWSWFQAMARPASRVFMNGVMRQGWERASANSPPLTSRTPPVRVPSGHRRMRMPSHVHSPSGRRVSPMRPRGAPGSSLGRGRRVTDSPRRSKFLAGERGRVIVRTGVVLPN